MTSITAERAGLRKVGRPLISRETAGLIHDYTNSRTVTEPATTAFVHITVTNYKNYNSDAAHWRGVEAIGRSRFPATGISYNRGHMRSGRAYEGQPIGRRGAHTVNDFKRSTCSTNGCPGRGGSLTAPSWNLNYTAHAYVICQNVGDDVPAAMLDSVARSIAADMLAGFLTRTAKIHGHRCVSSKSCPADPMWRLMAELARKVAHYVRYGFGTAPQEEDLVTTQAQFDTFMDNWVKRVAIAKREYDKQYNAALAAGNPIPAMQGAAYVGGMFGVLPWWQRYGRTPHNMHGMMGLILNASLTDDKVLAAIAASDKNDLTEQDLQELRQQIVTDLSEEPPTP